MEKIIGIDLGTTYMLSHNLTILVTVASTDNNKKITASAVYIKDKNVIVGDKALDALAATPKNVVTETKGKWKMTLYSVEPENGLIRMTIIRFLYSNSYFIFYTIKIENICI